MTGWTVTRFSVINQMARVHVWVAPHEACRTQRPDSGTWARTGAQSRAQTLLEALDIDARTVGGMHDDAAIFLNRSLWGEWGGACEDG